MKIDKKEVLNISLQLSYREMMNIISGGVATSNTTMNKKDEYGDDESQECWINIKMDMDAQNSLSFLKEYIRLREEKPPQ